MVGKHAPKPLEGAVGEGTKPEGREKGQEKEYGEGNEFGGPKTERTSEAETYTVEQNNTNDGLEKIGGERHAAGTGEERPQYGVRA